MKTIKSIAALAISVGAIAVVAAPAGARDSEEPTFSDPTQIDNPYLPIGKFHRCVYRGEEDGERQVIKRTLLDRTRTFVVDGVPVDVAIVKDRVKADGKLVEDTRDFFAQDDKGAVRYFGELVDDIENGHVAGHGGSWLYGRDTNKIGVLMAPRPHVGRHWMSEDAPPITVEHDRVVDRLGKYEVQGRTYRHAIKVREYALPDKEVEFKIYAKGVGVIDEVPPEGEVGLVGCSG